MLNEMTGERHLTTLPTTTTTGATNQTSVNLYYCGLVLPPPNATSEQERRQEREKERELEWKRLVESERPTVQDAHMKYRRQMLENAENDFIPRKNKKKHTDPEGVSENTETTEKVKMKMNDCKKAIVQLFRKMRRSIARRKDNKAGTTREVLC